MAKVIFNMSVSLDGFVAGPHDEVDQVFKWYASGDTDFVLPGSEAYPAKISRASAELIVEYTTTLGALLTGRRTYDLSKAWGGNPPMRLPTVVLTHKPDPAWVKPGSPFTFVTDGVESAIDQAKKLAGNKNVVISGASVLQQCLKAGLVDELAIDLVAVLLGDGVRLFNDHLSQPKDLALTRVVQGTGVTHLIYRVPT